TPGGSRSRWSTTASPAPAAAAPATACAASTNGSSCTAARPRSVRATPVPGGACGCACPSPPRAVLPRPPRPQPPKDVTHLMPDPIRVLLVDDHALVRSGFAMVLSVEEDIEVVGQAANGREALDALATRAADVVLMDVQMPVMDGIAATHEIVAAGLAK